MNDLKEFWDDMELTVGVPGCSDFGVRRLIKSLRQEEGMVFWERGGKWFVRNELIKDLKPELDLYKYLIRIANECVSDYTTVVLNYSFKARDFLDCLACLGEDKVKELIKKEGVKNG
jgi:hypothetical protein